jgi:hypothetical protein
MINEREREEKEIGGTWEKKRGRCEGGRDVSLRREQEEEERKVRAPVAEGNETAGCHENAPSNAVLVHRLIACRAPARHQRKMPFCSTVNAIKSPQGLSLHRHIPPPYPPWLASPFLDFGRACHLTAIACPGGRKRAAFSFPRPPWLRVGNRLWLLPRGLCQKKACLCVVGKLLLRH